MINVSYDVRAADGTTLSRRHALPSLPYTPEWDPPVLDQLGEAAHGHWKVLAGSSVLSLGAAGALTWRATRRPFLSAGAALGGAVAGWLLASTGFAIAAQPKHAPPAEVAGARTIASDPVAREQLKVMTYNLRGLMGPRGFKATAAEMDDLAETIRREQPDVLLLQELDDFKYRSSHVDGLAELAKRLRPTDAVIAAPGYDLQGGRQHVGVMTFNGFRIDDARNLIAPDPYGGGPVRRLKGIVTDAKKHLFDHVLRRPIPEVWSAPSYFPRIALDAVVVTPAGNELRVLGTHMNGPKPTMNYQDVQLAPLAMRLEAWRGPTILGGDFNVRTRTHPGRTERRLLGMAGLRDTFDAVGILPGDRRRDTGPFSPSNSDIDRIYASKHFRVLDTHVVREQRPASDHSPVVTTLEVNPDHARDAAAAREAAAREAAARASHVALQAGAARENRPVGPVPTSARGAAGTLSSLFATGRAGADALASLQP